MILPVKISTVVIEEVFGDVRNGREPVAFFQQNDMVLGQMKELAEQLSGGNDYAVSLYLPSGDRVVLNRGTFIPPVQRD